MADVVNDKGAALDREQHPPVTDSQSVVGLKVTQPLHISGQPAAQAVDLFDHAPGDIW